MTRSPAIKAIAGDIDVSPELFDQLSEDDRRQIVDGRARLVADVETAVAARMFGDALTLAGRWWGPTLLFEWWYGGHMTRDGLRHVIADVWQ